MKHMCPKLQSLLTKANTRKYLEKRSLSSSACVFAGRFLQRITVLLRLLGGLLKASKLTPCSSRNSLTSATICVSPRARLTAAVLPPLLLPRTTSALSTPYCSAKTSATALPPRNRLFQLWLDPAVFFCFSSLFFLKFFLPCPSSPSSGSCSTLALAGRRWRSLP